MMDGEGSEKLTVTFGFVSLFFCFTDQYTLHWNNTSSIVVDHSLCVWKVPVLFQTKSNQIFKIGSPLSNAWHRKRSFMQKLVEMFSGYHINVHVVWYLSEALL